VTAVADVAGTLLGFALFALVASVLTPLAPPFATLVALWFVGLPAAFAVSVVGVAAATRLRAPAGRLRARPRGHGRLNAARVDAPPWSRPARGPGHVYARSRRP
jgi:hypothetical protein